MRQNPYDDTLLSQFGKIEDVRYPRTKISKKLKLQ